MAGLAPAAELKSGLQPGDAPDAFNVRDVTGPAAGETLCYRCKYGSRPVVSIFAREIDDNVAKLIKEVDGVVGKNGDKKMAAFVVLLTDDPDAAEKKLSEVAKKNGIKNVPLTIYDGAAGPEQYKVSEKADVTVMMWVESDVKVNHAFGKGEFKGEKIAGIVSDTTKILE
jgi:hypothetical protein